MSVWAADRPVTIGTILFPPSTNIEPDTGKCVGVNIEKTRMILQHFNIEPNFVCTSPIRIYRMIENNEIDLTINIKSTTALAPHVEFTDVPFRKIVLNLYQYKDIAEIQSISAVRGFDYNGYRQKYSQQDKEFLDLPNTISAIQVFVRQRSDALLSYQAPMEYFLKTKNINLADTVIRKELLTLESYYAINKQSPYFALIKSSLNDFAQEFDIDYYMDFEGIKN